MVVSSFVGGVGWWACLENDAGTETPTLPIGAVFSRWGLIGTSRASSSLGEEHALSAKDGGVVDLEESTVVGCCSKLLADSMVATKSSDSRAT